VSRPWRRSPSTRAFLNARARARREAFHDQDFRTQGHAFLTQVREQYRLDLGAIDLLECFFGLGIWLDRPLVPLGYLKRLACLNHRDWHVHLTCALLWALTDPEARQWVHPRFYQPSSTDSSRPRNEA
jgi:hypothetical protein